MIVRKLDRGWKIQGADSWYLFSYQPMALKTNTACFLYTKLPTGIDRIKHPPSFDKNFDSNCSHQPQLPETEEMIHSRKPNKNVLVLNP